MTNFNPTRATALATLTATLDDLIGKPGISEKRFHAEWQARLAAEPDIISDGWYTPPPQGMAVLFGERVTFDTLRNPEFWPGERVIDWGSDMLFAYSSPVGCGTGILGDVGITLYFGRSETILSHFRKTHAATIAVLDAVASGAYETSFSLVSASNELFAARGLRNATLSINDPTTVNMGHSFPVIGISQCQKTLTDEQKDTIRKARHFLNLGRDWRFAENMQFTVEPQLVSITDPALPQIAYHYLARKTVNGFETCRDVDALLERFKLV